VFFVFDAKHNKKAGAFRNQTQIQSKREEPFLLVMSDIFQWKNNSIQLHFAPRSLISFHPR
jgi:hypothetical protein